MLTRMFCAQAILCAADDTLEPPKTVRMRPDGDTVDLIDGLGSGSVHQCRPAHHMWTAAEESRDVAWKPWEHQPGDTVRGVLQQQTIAKSARLKGTMNI